jgi:septal ring factor EnvC (AmiA/AmiB activator)
VAAAGVVAALAAGDSTILRVALAAVMAVALVLALFGVRRTSRLRAALAGEAAARRAEVAALQRESRTLTGMVEGLEAGRLTLTAEVAGLRALVTQLQQSLAEAQRAAEDARAEAAAAAAEAAARAAVDDMAAEAALAADDNQITLWPDLSEAPTVVDLLAWEEQAALRRIPLEGARKHA